MKLQHQVLIVKLMLAKMGRNAREDGVSLDKNGIPRDKDGFVRLVPKGYSPNGTTRKENSNEG